MSLQSLPVELFLVVAGNLGPQDTRSLLLTGRKFAWNLSQGILNFAVGECGHSMTALHLAAANGDREVVKLILSKTSLIDITVPNSDGVLEVLTTPIPDEKLSSTIECLVRAGGASVVRSSECGQTALHYAARSGHEVMVKRLLGHGVADSGDTSGEWAIHYAAASGHEDVVRQLVLKGGHSCEAVLTRLGDTALHRAVQHGRTGVVRVLLEEFHWDVNPAGQYLRTPLHIATASNHQQLVKLLLRHKADTTLKNADGEVAAEVAYSLEQEPDWIKMVKLIESADIHIQCPDGETALHRAARLGSVKMVRCLLNSGAHIDAQDKGGRTPLHCAYTAEVAFELLDRGADDSLKACSGLRAIDMLRDSGDARSTSIFEMFVGLGRE